MAERCRVRGCRCVVVEDGLCRTCLAGEVWRREEPSLPKSLEWLSLDLLEATVAVEGWEEAGACFGRRNTEVFFPVWGEDTAKAKRVCESCPAVYACLRYALDHQPAARDHGIWGCTSARQRQPIRRVLEQRAMRRELEDRVAS